MSEFYFLLFLVFLIIIMYAMSSSELNVIKSFPSTVLILTVGWIAYEYIQLQKQKSILKNKQNNANNLSAQNCNQPNISASNKINMSDEIVDLNELSDDDEITEEITQELNKQLYTNNAAKYQNLHNANMQDGDSALANRMKVQSGRAKESIDNKARFNKYSLGPYLEQELQDHANMRWWDNPALEQHF